MGYISNKTVKCRKEHKCVWCGERIDAGELADRCVCSEDSRIYSVHSHQECVDAMNLAIRDEKCDPENIDWGSQPRGMTEEESDKEDKTP